MKGQEADEEAIEILNREFDLRAFNDVMGKKDEAIPPWEEKLMKLRKSLLEAADAISEIADEMFSYNMKKNVEND
uniref:Uncharacterized protein n=1 Tax=Globodera rostochiensis TaxID=31243 RepID=A0A914H4Q1_GLORO